MNSKERNDLLYSLILNYSLSKDNDKLWQREGSSEYLISKGKLLGACMALDLELVETPTNLLINTRSGKELVRYKL